MSTSEDEGKVAFKVSNSSNIRFSGFTVRGGEFLHVEDSEDVRVHDVTVEPGEPGAGMQLVVPEPPVMRRMVTSAGQILIWVHDPKRLPIITRIR